MKKLLLYFIFLAITSGLTAEFILKSPFNVDDFEEGPDNLDIKIYSSNPILFPNDRLLVTETELKRILFISPYPNVYGQGIINIDVSDTGLLATRSGEFFALPGTPSNTSWTNNTPLNPIVVTTISPNVSISWNNPPQKLTAYPFLIKRSTSPLKSPENPITVYKTVGSTYGTNIVDTNVITGTQYYYIITWIDNWATNFTNVPMKTNYNFTMGVSPPVKLLFNGNVFGFSGKANKTYNIMTKPHMKNQVLWELIDTITLSTDQFVLLDEPIYRNKPIYVRELD